MAREAVIVELYGENNSGCPINYTVADGNAITKGTYLKFADPRTASASTGTGDYIAGFAAFEKEASDGITRMSVLTNGIFDLTASGAITAGQYVKTAVPGNYVMAITAADASVASYANIVGVALETASDGEQINVRVNL